MGSTNRWLAWTMLCWLLFGCASASNLAGIPVTKPRDPALVLQYTHAERPTALAVSGGPRPFAVVGGHDGVARLWDLNSGLQFRHLAAGGGEIDDVDVSPSGERVLTVQGGNAIVWDARTGMPLFRAREPHNQTWVDKWIFREEHEGPDANPFHDRITRARFLNDSERFVTVSETVAFWKVGQQTAYHRGSRDLLDQMEVSSDRKHVLTHNSFGDARVWDATNLTAPRLVTALKTNFMSDAAFTHGGAQVLVASNDGLLTFDGHSGEPLLASRTVHTFSSPNEIEVSPDGKLLAVLDFDLTLHDLESGKTLLTQKAKGSWGQIAFTPDGKSLIVSDDKGGGTIVDVKKRAVASEFGGRGLAPVQGALASSNGKDLLTHQSQQLPSADDALRGDVAFVLWSWSLSGARAPHALRLSEPVLGLENLPGGDVLVLTSNSTQARDPASLSAKRELERPVDKASPFGGYAYVPKAGLLARTSSTAGVAWIWDVPSGRVLCEVKIDQGSFKSIALSPSGKLLVAARNLGTLRDDAVAWRVDRRKRACTRLGSPQAIGGVGVEYLGVPNDTTVVVKPSASGTLLQWEPATGHTKSAGEAFYLSPDGRFAIEDKKLRDVLRDKTLFTLDSGFYYENWAMSEDGKWVSSSHSGGVTIWEVASGRKVMDYAADGFVMPFMLHGALGRRAIGFHGDAGVALVSKTSQAAELTLLNDSDDVWIAVDPSGAFDTNNVDRLDLIAWVMKSDPMAPLPADVFMRDFFQPGLLGQLAAGTRPRLSRNLRELNLAQPQVDIVAAAQNPNRPQEIRAQVTVSERTRATSTRAGVASHSGAFDLRVFRNDQLVYRTAADEDGSDQDLNAWRIRTKLLTANEISKTYDLTIQAPQRDELGAIELSAYAFNTDRVKSRTAHQKVALPQPVAGRLPRAYVIFFAVGANTDERWSLPYAAEDARALSRSLISRLRNSCRFSEVVCLPLISSRGDVSDVCNSAAIPPTKANLRAALRGLAGKTDALGDSAVPAWLSQLPSPVAPQDAVFIAVAAHGATSPSGAYYLLPYDFDTAAASSSGTNVPTHAISSSELASWLTGVDAERISLLLDTCHAEAALDAGAFKPGPMGDPGLGQLAYDKRMSVLVASQATSVAWGFGNSVVVQAFANEGLKRDLSRKPNAPLTLIDAFRYAERRVPSLMSKFVPGTTAGAAQQPRLFVFPSVRGAAIPDVVLDPIADCQPAP